MGTTGAHNPAMLDTRATPTPLYPERTRSVPTTSRELRVRWRLLCVLSLAFWLGARWCAVRLTPGRLGAVDARIRSLLERCGGAWVKAGQLVAMRRDLFPPGLCDALAALQDRTVGFPGEQALSVLEEELRLTREQVFSEFQEEPIAAGSVGQVHRARLVGGVEVAVKIQRVGIETAFAADMRLVRLMVRLLGIVRFMPEARWDEFAWELEQMFANELDYRSEAASQNLMRTQLRKHNVYVPKVFWELTSRRVLVMEFVTGVAMSEFIEACEHDRPRLEKWLAQNDIEPRRVGYYLYDTHTRQVFEDNLFHADLHPGNIVLLRGSRIALIDFGSVGSIDTNRLKKYYLLFQSIARGAFEKAADMLLLLSPEPLGAVRGAIKSDLIRQLRIWRERSRIRSLPYHEKSLTTLMGGMALALKRHRVPATWEFMRVNRAEVTMDLSLAYLLPDIDYFTMIRAYERQARRRELERAFSDGSMRNWVTRAHQLAETLDYAGERAYFDAEWVRDRAILLGSSTSTFASAVSAVVGLMTRLMTVLLFALPLLFLYQRGLLRGVAAWLEVTPPLDRLPRLSVAALLVCLAVLVYLRMGFGRIHRHTKR